MDLPPALGAIVRDLDAHPHHTAATLGAALRRDVTIDDVAPWIQFDATNYVRSLIAQGERWELRLLCWRPNQSSSLHAHHGRGCAFRIIRGSVTETILGERDRVWTPGAVVEETSALLVHQVGNGGADPALTLHAYSPRLPVDAPSPARGRAIAIVGGGFAGVALAYHLLRTATPETRITLIERGPWLGRGVAYGVDSRVFRLNVPASRMSIDPSRPDDFVEWAGAQAAPHEFLSRTQYGAYVVERFATAVRASRGKLRVVRGDAIALDADGVRLADGRVLDAAAVVLATGIAPRIARDSLAADARVIDAWDECGLATLPPQGRVLVLGAGLSALDVLSLLQARGFRGTATVLSRRALLPRPHLGAFAAAAPLPADVVAAAPRTLRGLLGWARELVRDAANRGEPWQLALDAIRPHVPALWQSLTPRDRARFVRSVRPYWDVLRHRAPRESLAIVESWRTSGRLELVAGTIAHCEPRPDALDVTLRTRAGGVRRERFDAIVRCIGPAIERSERETPLVAALVEAGHAMRDPAGLGIATDPDGRVIDADGRPSERIFALGALRRASEWETTAVPEITRHAQALARQLAAHRSD